MFLQLARLQNDITKSAQDGITWQAIGSGVVMWPWSAADVETAAQQQGLLAQSLVAVRVI